MNEHGRQLLGWDGGTPEDKGICSWAGCRQGKVVVEVLGVASDVHISAKMARGQGGGIPWETGDFRAGRGVCWEG